VTPPPAAAIRAVHFWAARHDAFSVDRDAPLPPYLAGLLRTTYAPCSTHARLHAFYRLPHRRGTWWFDVWRLPLLLPRLRARLWPSPQLRGSIKFGLPAISTPVEGRRFALACDASRRGLPARLREQGRSEHAGDHAGTGEPGGRGSAMPCPAATNQITCRSHTLHLPWFTLAASQTGQRGRRRHAAAHYALHAPTQAPPYAARATHHLLLVDVPLTVLINLRLVASPVTTHPAYLRFPCPHHHTPHAHTGTAPPPHHHFAQRHTTHPMTAPPPRLPRLAFLHPAGWALPSRVFWQTAVTILLRDHMGGGAGRRQARAMQPGNATRIFAYSRFSLYPAIPMFLPTRIAYI